MVSTIQSLQNLFPAHSDLQNPACLTHHQCLKRAAGGLVTQACPTLATPWTVAHQAPLSMGFSRQEYWSGLPFPSPMHESEK